MRRRPQPNLPGRPTKYTPAIVKAIVDAVRLGETRRGAAIAAGISEATFHEWCGRYPEFSEQLLRAEADLRMTHLRRIEAASRAGSWQASLALLERRFPNDFGRRTAIVGASGGPIEIVNRKIEDYPFLANPIVREAAATLIDALAAHEASEAVDRAETIAEDARSGDDNTVDGRL